MRLSVQPLAAGSDKGPHVFPASPPFCLGVFCSFQQQNTTCTHFVFPAPAWRIGPLPALCAGPQSDPCYAFWHRKPPLSPQSRLEKQSSSSPFYSSAPSRPSGPFPPARLPASPAQPPPPCPLGRRCGAFPCYPNRPHIATLTLYCSAPQCFGAAVSFLLFNPHFMFVKSITAMV